MFGEHGDDTIWFQRGLLGVPEPIIGKNCILGWGALIDCIGQVTIGDECFFGHGVMILTGGHDYNKFGIERQNSATSKPVTLGKGVWVGSRAIIMPGVVIGDHAVVGAGSVVTHNVDPYTIVAGNPARPIKAIPHE